MKMSKKLAKIDKTITIASLAATAVFAVVRGVLELTHKLPKETEDESGIEVEVYEDTSKSGIEAANEEKVDPEEVVNFEENLL